MERLKQQLRQELMMSRIPVMEALVFITIVTVISVELYMNIKQPLFTGPVHPMYPVYMLVRVFYIMFLMGCVLGCFFERKMLRLLSHGPDPLTRLILIILIIGSVRGCSRRPAD